MVAMVVMTITLVAGRDAFPGTASSLRQSMRQARAEPGCIRSHVATDLAAPDTFHYVEEWSNESELREQLRSDRFQRLIAVMEAATARPRFAVHLVSREYGLEYIAMARSNGAST